MLPVYAPIPHANFPMYKLITMENKTILLNLLIQNVKFVVVYHKSEHLLLDLPNERIHLIINSSNKTIAYGD